MVKENGMVMMTERELELMNKEHERIVENLNTRIELLQTAMVELLHSTDHDTPTDLRVGKADFIAIYNKALEVMFNNLEKPNGGELPNDIYGNDFTIHWNGIYCNCGDGAAPSNYIIPAIEGINEEDDTEY